MSVSTHCNGGYGHILSFLTISLKISKFLERMHNLIKVNSCYWRILISCLVGFSCANISWATAGSKDYGYGAISKSMAGSGVADPEDSFAPALNPAGIAYLDQQMDIGVAIFSPRRGYDAASTGQPFDVAPGTHWSDKNYFAIPWRD